MAETTLSSALDSLLRSLTVRPVYVGYSGGLDSTVLLHALCQRLAPEQIVAIHVNHRLHPKSDAWQMHCQSRCDDWGCQLISQRVDIEVGGEGLEAAARARRYRVFDAQVPPAHALLLAHHLDDQLETFLQRLLRGSGLNGLVGMEPWVSRRHYQLVRPLLAVPRSALQAYAHAERLVWIEDSSNADPRYDRNFLRHRVLPVIEEHWPNYRRTLSRSLEHLSEANRQVDLGLLAELDKRLAHDGALKAVQWSDWSDERIQSLIHFWLRQQGVQPPSSLHMKRILDEVVRAKPDATPRVDFGDGSVRRFRTALYWVLNPVPPGPPPPVRLDTPLAWRGVGEITLQTAHYGPDRVRLSDAPLRLALRGGGESIWPAGRSQARDLKRLLQEYRLPPWQRDRLPLLYAGEHLVAVADLCIDRAWVAQEGEPGVSIQIRRSLD